MDPSPGPRPQLQHRIVDGDDGRRLSLSGHLTTQTIGGLRKQLDDTTVSSLRWIDGSGLEDCDGNGIALLLEIVERSGNQCQIQGLPERTDRLLEEFRRELAEAPEVEPPPPRSRIVAIGKATAGLFQDLRAQVAFVGELTIGMLRALRHPTSIRWTDTLRQAEIVGVDALPIVLLLGFLIGVILAYQALIPMEEFGAGIYVANLVSLSLLRELGPLMTAVILSGRSGSAFAAEIGTMKVDEELDALATFGLDAQGFLTLPRVMAAVFMMPILTIFLNLIGLVGAALVMLSKGFSTSAFISQVLRQVDYIDLLSGLFKALVFGLLVAGIGCLRGFQTGSGPSAVGVSTTRAVVSGIVLIIAADGVFAFVYNALGI